MTVTSVFAPAVKKAWPIRYRATLHVDTLVGGTPTHAKVAEGWLKKKLGYTDEQALKEHVDQIMDGMVSQDSLPEDMAKASIDKAVADYQAMKHLSGFRRDADTGELFIEGRQIKAAIKEAALVAVASGKIPGGNKWGTTGKGIKNFLAEHVMVVEDRIGLGVTAPTDIMQRFVHTYRGSAIQYEEYLESAVVSFTVISDYDFDKVWPMIWLTGEQQGIGASRSQGYGRYVVTQWDRV